MALSSIASGVPLWAALSTPSVTSLTVVDSSQLQVSWTPVPGATRYEVQVRLREDGPWQSAAFVGAKYSTTTISGFSRSTEYYARVRASTLSESSDFSEPKLFSIGEILRPPETPLNLRMVDRSYKDIVIGWDPAERAAGYAVGIREPSQTSGVYYELWGISTTNHLFVGLQPETDYIFTVLARGNGLGDSAISPPLTATTLPQPPASASVTLVGAATNLNGDWPEYFGAEGYLVAGGSSWVPKSLSLMPNAGAYTWNLSTSEPYAPLQDPGRTNRISATFDFFAANGPNRLVCDEGCEITFYFVDWPERGLPEELRFIDEASDRVVARTTVADFETGIYLTYRVRGNVRLEFGSPDSATIMFGNPMLVGIFWGGPVRTAKARLSVSPAGTLVTLKIAAPAGRNYILEKTRNFRDWTVRSTGKLDLPEGNVTLDPREPHGGEFFRVRLE